MLTVPTLLAILLQALQMIESAHGDSTDHPTVGIALGLLGHVYARSKRITLAEGLHRYSVTVLLCCCKDN